MKYLLLLLSFIAASATANTIQLSFEVSPSCYDLVSRTSCQTPASSMLTVTFPLQSIRSVDYGSTTITEIGDLFDVTFSSPYTSLLPYTLSSGRYGDFYNSYAFPNVSDYETTFLEEMAAQANTFTTFFEEGEQYARYYHVEFRITTRSDPRSGVGTDDYAFTENTLLTFLQTAVDQSLPVYFTEGYGEFRYLRPSGAEYIDGKIWSDYNAKLTSVSVVSEPATGALLILGLLTMAIRRRSLG